MSNNFSTHVPSWWLEKPNLKNYLFHQYMKRFHDLLNINIQSVRDKFPDYSLYGVVEWCSLNFGQAWLYAGQELTYNYLYYLNQLRLAWFQYTMNEGKPITLMLADRTVQTAGKFKNYRISAFDVAEGIQTALLLRDKTALDYFAQIPVSFTEQSPQDDLIVEIMMAFYQLLARGKANSNEARATFQALSEQLDWEIYKRYVAVEGFNQSWVWERIFAARKEYAEYVSLPVINIYYQILENNRLGFESAVEIALEKWKTYYTRAWIDENKEDQDRSLLGEGFLSLPIVSACAFGYDRGIKLVGLESSYIPQWLIEGDFASLTLLVDS